MAKEAQELKPKFAVDATVTYTDRHGRHQCGRVIDIEGKWTFHGSAYLVYRVRHPTYRNGYFYCGEDALNGATHD